jgi:ABC-type multidrug transport system ATPase subunit
MLATLLPIDAGQARVFGVDVAREPHRVRQLIGVTGQYASVDEDLTATENLWMFGRLQGLRSADARAAAGGCWRSSTWRKRRTSRSRSSPAGCAADRTSRPA